MLAALTWLAPVPAAVAKAGVSVWMPADVDASRPPSQPFRLSNTNDWKAVRGFDFRRGIMEAVAVSPSGDVWAVGNMLHKQGLQFPIIERWDGAVWARIAPPDFPNGGLLHGVAVTESGDVWVVGGRYGSSKPQLLRWSGSQWKAYDVPVPPNTSACALGGITAIPGGGAWAVGACASSSDPNAASTFVLKLAHGTWSIVPSPNHDRSSWNGLSAVSASSPSRAFALGHWSTDQDEGLLVARWDGERWRQMPVPSLPPETTEYGIAAAPGRAWIAGDAQGSKQPLILQLNDGRWDLVPLDGLGIDEGALWGIAARRDGAAWAVGAQWSAGDGRNEPMVLRWRGGVWHLMRMADLGEEGNLFAVAAAPGDVEWAVGARGYSEGMRPLIMRKR